MDEPKLAAKRKTQPGDENNPPWVRGQPRALDAAEEIEDYSAIETVIRGTLEVRTPAREY